jgi:dipeptidase
VEGATFAYWDAGYGVMNEHQVAIGESSCSASVMAPAPSHFLAPGGGAPPLRPVEEMSRIALERCATARCAVRLMGSLAEEHGFLSVTTTGSVDQSGSDPNEGGESLLVGDTEEAWVFHVLSDGCPLDKCGAIWVAQRVPDDEVEEHH